MAKETNKDTTQKVEANAIGLSIVKRSDGKAELRKLNYNKETNLLVNVETVLVADIHEVEERFKVQAFEGFFA